MPPLSPSEPARSGDAAPPAFRIRLPDILALGSASIAIGVAVSVIMTDVGTSPLVTMLAAILAFSGTGELAYASVISGGGGLVPALLAALLVSSRFALLAMSMTYRWPASLLERVGIAHLSSEPAVGAALAAGPASAARGAFWKVALALTIGWIAGSGLGLIVGKSLGDSHTIGLDAVFPASLVTVAVGAMRQRDTAVAVLLGVLVALLLTPFTPAGIPILVASGAALVAARVAPRPWRRAASTP